MATLSACRSISIRIDYEGIEMTIEIKPTQGAYQKPITAELVRETKTLIIVKPEGYMYEWRFNKSDGLRVGADKNKFPRYQIDQLALL